MSYEDDRIRNKNSIYNEAHKIYQDLKAMGYSDSYIVKYAKFANETTSDYSRSEILLKVINIAGYSNESVVINS